MCRMRVSGAELCAERPTPSPVTCDMDALLPPVAESREALLLSTAIVRLCCWHQAASANHSV